MKRLCAAAEIAEREGRGFVFRAGDARDAVFVIRWKGTLYGYRNSCPHTGSPLDWPANRFFDRDRGHLVCRTHGAAFRPEDGVCIDGPCRGRALTSIALEIEGGEVAWIE